MNKAFQLEKDLYWTGILDPNLKVFDIIMETKYGTSYNSYILKGSKKTAMFETSKFALWEETKEYIESVVEIADIDYLIMDHTEPDHAGTVEKLLDINPGMTIVGTGTAISFLQHIVNHDFNSIAVKENDTLSLGDKTLDFMVLPFLHWPDTMYTWCEEIKTLFTCDSFGSHYSCDGIVRSAVTDEAGYADATKYYFDCIIGPFKRPYMSNALDRIKDLEIERICTGHGPVLDSHLDQVFGWYKEWCAEPPVREKKLIVMPYVSAYGYTKQLSEQIAKGCEDAGDVEVHRYDLIFDDTAKLGEDMGSADGYLFGTPTIVGEALEPIWKLTIGMFPPVFKGRLASAFGSYGWSGEGVPHIIERLKQSKLKVVDGFRVRFKPSENQLTDAYDFGYNFACVLLKKEPKKSGGSRSLVKCLVCGAIFDSSLSICPVCGVGKENFIPVEDTGDIEQRNSDKKYLILGGGIAALEAAKAIRERDRTGGITILSDEPDLPYNRPMLTKAMLSDFASGQLAVEQQKFYDENRISIVLNAKVTKIDPENKAVFCGEMKLVYDKLIYALGAHCFIPPIKGKELDKVVDVRTIADVKKVQSLLPNVKNAVVIGGGVLGLEAAWSLKKAKIDVTVIQNIGKLLNRQLTEDASDVLAKVVEDAGIRFITNAEADTISEEGVTLKDGTALIADLVIISAGVVPNTGLAKEAGIACGKAVIVNEKMETSLPDIYAAGDCAEFEGMDYALWSQAVDQGRTAGANASGDEAAYETVDGALTFNGMGTSLYSIGDNGKNPEKIYRTVELKDTKRSQYEKYTFENNRLVGVILIGDTSRLAELSQKVKDHARYGDVIGI